MHFDTTISLGAIVGWAITALGFAYGVGRLAQVLTTLTTTVNELKTNHHEHCEDDIRRFESVGKQLQEIALATGGKRR